ncbi:MAG: N-acetyltransferase [Rhizobiales bacterium]|nr:N-acetyltransferase [Hyphomicrobiales bacterium]
MNQPSTNAIATGKAHANSLDEFIISPYNHEYNKAVTQLLNNAFGENRLKKSSYKLRETCKKIDSLSYVILADNTAKDIKILASIEYWQLNVAGAKALLLGPLAVDPASQGLGLGRKIIEDSLKLARELSAKNAWSFVILIGDLDYYAKCGFKRVPLAAIDYPKPTDPNRILYLEFKTGSLNKLIESSNLPLLLNQ